MCTFEAKSNNLDTVEKILRARLHGERLDRDVALKLWREAMAGQLVSYAHECRMRMHPKKEVGWIVDRNVNYTNVCISMCSFCNFCRPEKNAEAYVLTDAAYDERIEELFKLGGEQLLLQGGMHPHLGLAFYIDLFTNLKKRYPRLKLHALGPPEIVHLAGMEGLGAGAVLKALVAAGLDSLPGAGAEILSDRVRKQVSPAKCSADEWLDVMREAHRMHLVTSATMMFGHIETIEERIEHMLKLRAVQDEKPKDAPGFLSFIPWPFQAENTRLKQKLPAGSEVSGMEYIRTIALSRLVLDNIPNIQASWLTVGKETAQLCLHAGANDFGSIMIEERVVSGAGADHRFDAAGICRAIEEAGFIPVKRNQRFEKADV